jgi:hypothetical protein
MKRGGDDAARESSRVGTNVLYSRKDTSHGTNPVRTTSISHVSSRYIAERRCSIDRLSQPKVRFTVNDLPLPEKPPGAGKKTKPGRSTKAIAQEESFLVKLREIVYDEGTDIDRPSPTMIMDYVYLGSYWDANNPEYLTRLGITHVLNCSAGQLNPDECPYHPDTGILWYAGIPAVDKDSYDMLQHVEKACSFIKKAKVGGKVLVHSTMGINRSVILVAIYLIGALKVNMLRAVRLLKDKRCNILQNVGFQKQLVKYAQSKGQLLRFA